MDQRPFQLVSALARALSHQIRTPLSIISNDLFFFQSLIDPQECRRSLEKTRCIAGILNQACAMGKEELRREPIDLESLARDVFADAAAPDYSAEQRPVLTVPGDPVRLRLALECLKAAACFTNGPAGSAAWRMKVDFDGTGQTRPVRLCLIDSRLGFERGQAEDFALFSSFSRFYEHVVQGDSLLPIIADAVFWAHGAEIEVRVVRGCAAGIFISFILDAEEGG